MTVIDTSASGEQPAAAQRRASGRWATRLLLIAILVIGAYLRFLNLFGWDEPSFRLHPDERFFTDVASVLQVPSSFDEYIDSSRNPLNPRNYSKSPWYVYGLLPQTITQFTAVMLTPNSALPRCVDRPDAAPDKERIGSRCDDPTVSGYQDKIVNNDLGVPKVALLQQWLNPQGHNMTEFYEVFKVGRAWSMFFDLCSVLLTFLIGRRLYGARAGLLAAAFMAFAVLPIQLAHFFTVDAATACFVLLAVYWAVRCAQGGGVFSFALFGVSIGAAMACRVTLATLGLLGACAVAVRLWQAYERGELTRRLVISLSLMLALAGVLSIIGFRLLQPDAFVGRSFLDLRPEPRFIENIQRIGAFVSGEADAPPNQQWAGRAPYLFPLQNLVLWGLGLPLGVAALVAWVLAGWQLLLRRRLVHLIPWVWVTFYFAWQGGQFVTTMRYYSSMYGLLAVLAAWALVAWVDRSSLPWHRWTPRWFRVSGALAWASLLVVLVGTALWAYAFTRIYTQPHSRIAASRWIYDHIPAGSTITSESWDDGLPLNLDGRSSSQYTGLQMNPYDEDEPAKYFGGTNNDGTPRMGLLQQLDQADYLIYSSNRVYDSTKRLPMKYPALTRYYNALFEGKLGFKLVADLHSYPTLFGIEIPTPVWAEEAFSVYDHPRVLIFQKTAEYTRANAEKQITEGVAWGEVYKVTSFVGGKTPTALRLTTDQWDGYRNSVTSILPNIVGSIAPWLSWLIVLELVGFAAFALLFYALPHVPDRGFALSKTLGILVVAWLAWLLASLGASDGKPIMSFSPLSVWLCAAVLIVPGALIAWFTRARMLAFFRAKRTALLTAEGVFLAAFFAFLVIRALNPDLWHPARGGEKPMDLAFLTATLRSSAFPPYDPWFAGGYINYYYFGFVFVGALVHLSGVAPTVAYNLAVPTIFALTMLGAFGVVYNLLALRRRRLTPVALKSHGLARRLERRAIAAGVAAALFVAVLGPLTQAIWLLPGTADTADAGMPQECRALASYAAQQICRGRTEWALWDATRLVGMTISQRTGGNDSTITEFPFFTFVFGDLHAHMIALPLALAVLGLAVAVARTLVLPVRGANASTVIMLLLLGLTLGALAATNTWDLPAYLALSILTLGFVGFRRWQAGASLLRVLVAWGLASVALVVLTRLLFKPFYDHFATEYAGFVLWTGERTGVVEFLKINGLWLALIVFGAFALYYRVRGTRLRSLAIIGAVMALLTLAAILLKVTALALLIPLLIGAIGVVLDLLTRGDERRHAPLSMALLLPALWACAAIGLVFLTEVLVGKGDIGRMNTVFKLGMDSWTLFALAAAVAFTGLWSRNWHTAKLQEQNDATDAPLQRLPIPLVTLWLGRLASVVLVIGGLIYPLTATPAKIADRFDTHIPPTLDGTAYMTSPNARWGENNVDFTLSGDANALDWMRRNITGTPIVLEAQTEGYRWGSRVSIYTGLPTLLGWPWHETQQRNVAHVQPVLDYRRALVQQLYNSSDETETIDTLRQYGVEYVYVGLLEKALYDPNGLAKFDRMVTMGTLEKVYDAADTRIYHVKDVQDPPAILTTTIPVIAPTLAPTKALSLTQPVEMLPVLHDFAWNQLAQSEPVAVLLWLMAIVALFVLGLPLATLVFWRWRDGGVAFAPIIGLLTLGYLVWFPVSARLWMYDRAGIALATFLFVLLDALVLAVLARVAGDQRFSPLDGLTIVWARLREGWKALAWVAGLFLVGFAAMLVIRALNPDLWQPQWGGEKPFEFGFLNAIVRSPVMPPYDPFYSGGTINYYYYGLFLVSLPVKVTGIAPAIAFNLIIPTIFGLTLIGAFAVVRQLTNRVSYGLLGALFVAVLGNLASVFVTKDSWSSGLQPVSAALFNNSANFGKTLDAWFIGPSRVISYTINEFPFWTFLFADLHPHLIAMPIVLLVIALALVALSWRHFVSLEVLATLALASLALGALAVTNSWDFPTYTLLLTAALLGAVWLDRQVRGLALLGRLFGRLVQAGATAGVGFVLYLPFFQNFQPMVGGIGMVRNGTMPESYAVIYGVFLAVLIPGLLLALWRVADVMVVRIRAKAPIPESALGLVARPSVPTRALAWLPSVFLLLLVVTAAVLHQTPLALKAALFGGFVATLILLLNRRLATSTWFALVLAALGFAVSIGVDTVYIRDHLTGDPANPDNWYRMNTVFKFGMQIWMVLALAAATFLPLLLRGLRRVWGVLEIIVAAGVVAFIALGLVYPLVGTPSRVAYRFPVSPGPTLDGLKFLDTATFDWNGHPIDLHDDGEAIRWLNENVEGTPVVLQSSMEFYRAYGVRVAANTGLPTVVSPLHENEQRNPSLVAARDNDVILFYQTADLDTALRLLSKYRVGYVYVGPIERAAYGDAGMAKFQQLDRSYLNQVFRNDSVAIYKVNEGVYNFPTSVGSGTSPAIVQASPADPAPAQPAPVVDQDAIANPAGQPTLKELEAQYAADPTASGPAFSLAQRYRDLSRPDDAANVLTAAAQANPSDVALHHLWGDALRDAGRFDEAAKAYTDATLAQPTAGNYNKLGTELLHMDRLKEAEAALKSATERDDALADPYFQLGLLYEREGQNAEAANAYRDFLSRAAADSPDRAAAETSLRRLQ